MKRNEQVNNRQSDTDGKRPQNTQAPAPDALRQILSQLRTLEEKIDDIYREDIEKES